MTSSYIDLNKVVLADGADITTYNNTTTQWLALPNNSNKDDVDAIYSNLTTNGNLKAVVAFTTETVAATDTYGEIPANTLITYTSEQGQVYNLVYMIEETNSGQFAGNVKNVIMSGKLNAFDICSSTQAASNLGTVTSGTTANAVSYSMALGSDGHLYAAADKDAVNAKLSSLGLTAVTTGALDGATLNSIDFTNAIFDQPNTDV